VLLTGGLVVTLFLSACTSSDSDPQQEAAATEQAGGEAEDQEVDNEVQETPAGVDPRAGGPLVNEAGFDVVGVAYNDIDYDVKPAGSALGGERDRPGFPPPLIPPSNIVPVLGPDGIPAIDNPEFRPVDEVDFVEPNEAVVVVDINEEVRAYPIQIMVWHEIVNDEVGGVPVSVTYCPLCNSALAYDRRVGDRVLDFGTSGSLYQSALVMYDRQTESLWTHFTGEGAVGHYAGARLDLIPVQTLSFEEFAALHPDGLVLTRDTGASRDYGVNPYISYDEETTEPIDDFFQGDVDPRLEPKARVVGFIWEETAHAVTIEVGDTPTVHQVPVGGETVVIFQHPGLASALDRASVASGRDVGQTGVFAPASPNGDLLTFSIVGNEIVDDQTESTWTVTGKAVDGPLAGEQLTPVGHLNTFWFAWATYHPDTSIYDPETGSDDG